MSRAREVQKRAELVRVGDCLIDFRVHTHWAYSPVLEVARERDGAIRWTLASGYVNRSMPGLLADVLEVTR